MNLTESIVENDLFSHLDRKELDFLATVATEAHFNENEVVFEEDSEADTFFIIRRGRIGLELTSAMRRPIVIQTLGAGDLIGLSWLFPPYRWSWRARALDDTDAVAFDADRVRRECEHDPHLELEILRIISAQAVRRLHSSRTQLLDLYEFPR